MNLSYLFETGDAVLLTTFLLLIGMSAASWYVIFWKIWTLRKERQRIAHFQQRRMTHADWMHNLSSAETGSIALLLQQAEVHHGSGKEALEMYLSQTLDNIRVWLDKGLTILASVGSSAPFIGLFGTVWGVYNALTRIAAEGNASLNVVAGPMGEALVATAVGLFAAIPAVLAYNAFVRFNRVTTQELRHIAEQLALHLADEEAETHASPLRLVPGAVL